MLTKERIKESFSKHARTYDLASDFQKETGYRLIGMISPADLVKDRILDVGIGSGKVTQRLAAVIKKRIYGCDIAWGMVLFAKQNRDRILINQADAEDLPFKNNVFDIAFSNVTYQWVNDFNKAFSEIKRVLKKGGRFYFSILVKDTLKELYQTLGDFFIGDLSMDFLPTGEFVRETLMEIDFNIIWLKPITMHRYYKSCLDLLRSIKLVGAASVSESNLFGMGKRKLFFDMVEAYDTKFNEDNKVFATYKVVLGCVQKR